LKPEELLKFNERLESLNNRMDITEELKTENLVIAMKEFKILNKKKLANLSNYLDKMLKLEKDYSTYKRTNKFAYDSVKRSIRQSRGR